ncbi:unnamed protein product (macronuclear) [Paramecium tetraurelia]|uniref:Uncharacterized protein n=1 Tax=Paramecium tetraurelia TaxID=5888 RepID=A0C7I9_PARTE|nr:uncharacterized protein GSPATT00035886001 [Paramecium tetraurelia]CAK66756.1 unnamed protein product [Paramecium tetraurelia]|eukprot:XP_001434153.1 hypothetical protein (macronuclear) [Paramecium tetraurelia strain d4-2]
MSAYPTEIEYEYSFLTITGNLIKILGDFLWYYHAKPKCFTYGHLFRNREFVFINDFLNPTLILLQDNFAKPPNLGIVSLHEHNLYAISKPSFTILNRSTEVQNGSQML